MKLTNRDRILDESIHLFNQSGVAAVTTNHICKHLRISPGNLYFHFRDKEEILRELFARMRADTYAMWKSELHGANPSEPLAFLERSLEVFWKFRFFHREMYALRRQDIELNRAWHQHLQKTRRFMKLAHASWERDGKMLGVGDEQVIRVLSDIALVAASSFFQFVETKDKPAGRRPLQLASQYLGYLLLPYLSREYGAAVEARLR